MNQTQATSNVDTSYLSSDTIVSIARRPSRLMVTEPVAEWHSAVVARLGELIRLPPGWDGYRGEPVSFLIANFTLRMLEAVCGNDTPAPQIVPGSSGDVQIEWHTPCGQIELHVRAPNDVLAWHRNANTGADGEEIALSNDFIRVVRWIEDLERDGAAAAAA